MSVQEWLSEQGFQFKKTNVRDWGGYELLVSKDGITWASMGRPFGSRISEQEAFIMVLTSATEDVNLKEQITGWLGDSLAQEAFKILEES